MLSGLLMSGTVWGKHSQENDDQGNRHEQREHDRDGHGDNKRGYFEPREVQIIREYYAPRYRPLPPGLAKKYYRTGHLPPGWETRIEPVPVVVERELAPVPVGYRRGIIDGFAVIYSPRTGVILDVTAIFGR